MNRKTRRVERERERTTKVADNECVRLKGTDIAG